MSEVARQLTEGETRRLHELEEVVSTGLGTFVAVGRALSEISSSRLYLGTHGTFVAYAQDRFGIGKSHAYRMISAARVARAVSPIGDIHNEAQARELVGLNDDEARDVMAIARAGAKLQGRERPVADDLRQVRRAWERRDSASEQMSADEARDLTEFINITASFDEDVVDAEIVDEPDELGDRIARELAASDGAYAEQAATPEPEQRVQGTDGKSYPAAQPQHQRRKALTDAFWTAAYDMTKAVEKVTRLADDDRFPQNAEKVAAIHRSDLIRAIDALQGVVNRLPSA